MRLNRFLLLTLLIWLSAGWHIAATRGEDVVTIRPDANGSAAVMRGTIEDWTGKELRLRTRRGSTRRVLTRAVVDVATQWPPQRAVAADALARHDFAHASEQLERAIQSEKRPWARRHLLGDLIWSYRGQARWREACELFLSLARSDPDTMAFDRIPLAWFPRDAVGTDVARTWLARGEEPAATLLGVSYLIGTADGQLVVGPLNELLRHADPRIAALATAQSWRLRATAADEATLRTRRRQIETMPAAVRAGAYYLLAEAYKRAGDLDRAELTYWRVPLLYPRHRDLASRCLLDLGRSALKAGRRDEAHRALEEARQAYPETIEGRTAGELLQDLLTKKVELHRQQRVASAEERSSP